MSDSLLSFYTGNLSVDFLAAAYVEQPPEDSMFDYTPGFSSIGYILSGEGSIMAEGVDLCPRPGDIYLLPAHTLQSYSSVSDDSYKKYYSHFTANCNGVSLFDMVKVPRCYHAPNGEEVEALFREMCALQASDSPLAALRLHSLMEELLYLYLKNAPSLEVETTRNKSREKIEETLIYIERHLGETLSVRELAGRLFFNPDYFTRLFKSVTGETPRHYIARVRNQKAIQLLLSTNMSIAQIAVATGFETPAYFSGAFKKQNGLSPFDFRKLAIARRGEEE